MILKKNSLVKEYLKQFEDLLDDEKNPLIISPFIEAKFDKVIIVAAYLIYLAKRGITEQQIINTNIVVQFIKSNRRDSNLKKNDLRELSNLLAECKETFPLIGYIKRKSSLLNSKASYSEGKKEVNQSNKKIDNEFIFSPNKFIKFYKLFDYSFIISILMIDIDDKIKSLLENNINNLRPNELSNCLENLSDDQESLKKFSKYISPSKIKELIEIRDGNLFYLIPFRMEILNDINFQEPTYFNKYINSILLKKNNYSSAEQLSFILRALLGGNYPIEKTVYLKLINLFMNNNYLLEDKIICKKVENSLKQASTKYISYINRETTNAFAYLMCKIKNVMKLDPQIAYPMTEYLLFQSVAKLSFLRNISPNNSNIRGFFIPNSE